MHQMRKEESDEKKGAPSAAAPETGPSGPSGPSAAAAAPPLVPARNHPKQKRVGFMLPAASVDLKEWWRTFAVAFENQKSLQNVSVMIVKPFAEDTPAPVKSLLQAIKAHLTVCYEDNEINPIENVIQRHQLDRILHPEQFSSLPPMVLVLPPNLAISNWRMKLGIPRSALVFGTFGRDHKQTADLEYLQKVVCKLGTRSHACGLYFIFMNTEPFTLDRELVPGKLASRIHFVAGVSSLTLIREFINTCDAMLYARSSGQDFGMAIANFSLCGKPVLASTLAPKTGHLERLGLGNFLPHANEEDLEDLLLNFRVRVKEITPQNHGYSPFLSNSGARVFKKDVLDV